MSIRDFFTRNQKDTDSGTREVHSSDKNVGVEISGTMPDLGNPELNQLSQRLLEMSADFVAQQSREAERFRQGLSTTYMEASSAGAVSAENDVYLPRRGGISGATITGPADVTDGDPFDMVELSYNTVDHILKYRKRQMTVSGGNLSV